MMKASEEHTTKNRWDELDYNRIVGLRYNEADHMLTVRFADGSSPAFDPTPLVPPDLVEIDWWRTASNELEVIVPHALGWFEIPYDVVRLHTDPEFAAYWEQLASRHGQSRNAEAASVREEPPDYE